VLVLIGANLARLNIVIVSSNFNGWSGIYHLS